MSDIIDFAKVKADKEGRRFDDLTIDIEVVDDFSIDYAMSLISDMIVELGELGYDVRDNPKCVLELTALVEVIRAVVYRTAKIRHPYHDVSESMFDHIFEGEPENYEKALYNLLSQISEMT